MSACSRGMTTPWRGWPTHAWVLYTLKSGQVAKNAKNVTRRTGWKMPAAKAPAIYYRAAHLGQEVGVGPCRQQQLQHGGVNP